VRLSTQNILRRERFLKYSAYVFMGSLFIFLLKATWLKYGSLYVDTFHDPWIVDEILCGKVVYRDLFYEYGFLPPYFLAGLCRVFGYYLNIFIFCGAALAAGCGLFIYRIVRLFVPRYAATLVVTVFFVVFAFGQYYYPQAIFNFILPYSFASLFLVFFSLTALFCLMKFILKGKVVYAYGWVAATVLVFLSRPIIGTFVYLGFLLPLAIIAYKGFFRSRLKIVPVIVAPVLISAVFYVAFLWINRAWGGFNESILTRIAVRSVDKNAGYVAQSMGLNHAGLNFLVAVAIFVVVMVCVTLLVFAVRFFTERNSVALGLVCFAAAFIIGMIFLMNMDQYRYLPIVSVALALWYAYRTLSLAGNVRDAALCALFSVSFFMVFRIMLDADPAGCGFCFLAASLIGCYIFFFRIFSDFLCRKIKNFSVGLFHFFLIAFFIFINSFYPVVSWALLQKRTMPVAVARGGIIVADGRAEEAFKAVTEYLREHTDKNATVTAVPEISGINFFSQRRNPLHCCSPCRAFFNFCVEEEKIAGEFAAKRPDYIVVLSSKGSDHLGVDYGFKLNVWIKNNYQIEKIFGDYPYHGGMSGGMAILKRKSG